MNPPWSVASILHRVTDDRLLFVGDQVFQSPTYVGERLLKVDYVLLDALRSAAALFRGAACST